jgi:hypothetical protein
MNWRTLTLLLALVLSMGFAGGCDRADAAGAPPEGWGAAELRIAQEYWGTTPTDCSTLTVEFDATDILSDGASGEATRPTGPGTPCLMRIARGMGVWAQCRVVVHEYGHWVGLRHSSDRHSVMYFEGPYWADVHGCDVLAGVTGPVRTRYAVRPHADRGTQNEQEG